MAHKKQFAVSMHFLASVFLILLLLSVSACSKATSPSPVSPYPELSVEDLLITATERREKGDYKEAELRLRAVVDLQLEEKPLQTEELQATLFELGSVASLQENDLDAYQYYTRALRLSEGKDGKATSDTEARRQLLLSRGNALMKLARYSEASNDFIQARFVTQRLYGAFSHEMLLPLNNLGALHLNYGDLHKAEAILLAAQRVALSSEESTPKERILITRNLLNLYKRKKDTAKIREYRFLIKKMSSSGYQWKKR